MKFPSASPAAVKLFEELIPDDPRVTVRKMFGQPAAFVQGNMFLGVFGKEVFIRLSEKDRRRAESELGMRPFAPMKGREMREYRVLPEELLEEPRRASEWVDHAVTWTSSLPPKSAQVAPGTKRTAPKRPAHRAVAR